jgi:phenylpyruvate tautomerase PptA (4-oxalocrotonate tautomerase family)
MPLVRIDVVADRRSAPQLRELQDTVHDVVVSAFGVPMRDRYQILQQHEPAYLQVEDTGLGFERTVDVVVLQITSRPRPREQKQAFYADVARQLEKRCGLAPTDLMVAFTENTDADWSFGFGRAQFLTGEL